MAENKAKLAEMISRADAVIFDFGGVLYKSSREIKRIFGAAGARIGQRYVPHLRNDFDEALRLCLKSHEDCGYGTFIFAKMADVDPRVVNEAFQIEVARTLTLKNDRLSNALDDFAMPRALLTQSCWALACDGLEQTGIRKHFPDGCIYTSDKTPAPKSESPAAVRHVLDKQGWLAGTTIMIDDSPINLSHAKSLGVMTVLATSDVKTRVCSVDCPALDASEFLTLTHGWHPLRSERVMYQKSPSLSKQPELC